MVSTKRYVLYRQTPDEFEPENKTSVPHFDTITRAQAAEIDRDDTEPDEDSEPAFNNDTEQREQPAEEPSGVRKQTIDNKAAASRPLDALKKSTSGHDLAQASASNTTQATLRRTLSSQITNITARIAAATPAWMIKAGIIAAQALQSKKVQHGLQIAIVIFIFGPAILLFLVFGTQTNLVNQKGPSISGGTRVEAQTDSYNPAVAAQLGGQIITTSIESIGQFSQAAHKLITESPPKGAQITQALAVLNQIDQLKTELENNTYRDDRQTTAQIATKYKKLVQDLLIALYPERKDLRDKVMSLVHPPQGTPPKINLTQAAGCNPERDLQGYGVSAQTLAVMIAAADKSPITVTCLISGHRKFVGKPPSQGYPRCGDLTSKPDNVVNAAQSYHCTGRAVDISPNSTVQDYLEANKGALHIRNLQLESDANHLHIEVQS